MQKAPAFTWFGLGLLLCAGVVLSSQRVSTPSAPVNFEPGVVAAPAPSPSPIDVNLFRDIARRQNPAVVTIVTRSRVQEGSGDLEDYFSQFFGGRAPAPREHVQRALGSGFIISKDGLILTNNHVVAGADRIEVSLFDQRDRRTSAATVVGRDPLSDTALIKLQTAPGDLPIATLGNSGQLAPGDWVMAIGNPFELGHTVTVGVVSYVGRPYPVAEGRWQEMIQTDASINPGNSGGPLINVAGEVVGINTAILGGGSGGNVGIGFAVPIDTVKALLPQLEKGKVVRGRIGVQLRSGGAFTDDEAKALGLTSREGALITAVEPGSPADKAGLTLGDVIVELGGKPIADASALGAAVSAASPGARLDLKAMRDGALRSFTIVVEALQTEPERNRGTAANRARLGLALEDFTPAIARQLQLPFGAAGALVTQVEPDSPAAAAGLQRGDVITSINRRAMRNATEAISALQQLQTGQTAFLLVTRGGTRMLVELRREE